MKEGTHVADEHVRIVIVGAGPPAWRPRSGYKREGIEDFRVLERADDVGGTWTSTTYALRSPQPALVAA